MKRLLSVAVVASCIAAAGCGGTTTTKKTVTVAPPPAATTPTAKAEPTAPSQVEKSGGITIRVLDVTSSKTVRYQGGTQSDVTPDATPKTVRAPQGGRYVYVKTRVSNGSKTGLDLTCGLPVTVSLLDTEDNQYDLIEGTSQIAGNPECNVELQPGFKKRMTWIFLVPPKTDLDSFAFIDTTDLDASETPAQIVLTE